MVRRVVVDEARVGFLVTAEDVEPFAPLVPFVTSANAERLRVAAVAVVVGLADCEGRRGEEMG